jgi:hypothetical protein
MGIDILLLHYTNLFMSLVGSALGGGVPGPCFLVCGACFHSSGSYIKVFQFLFYKKSLRFTVFVGLGFLKGVKHPLLSACAPTEPLTHRNTLTVNAPIPVGQLLAVEDEP